MELEWKARRDYSLTSHLSPSFQLLRDLCPAPGSLLALQTGHVAAVLPILLLSSDPSLHLLICRIAPALSSWPPRLKVTSTRHSLPVAKPSTTLCVTILSILSSLLCFLVTGIS